MGNWEHDWCGGKHSKQPSEYLLLRHNWADYISDKTIRVETVYPEDENPTHSTVIGWVVNNESTQYGYEIS